MFIRLFAVHPLSVERSGRTRRVLPILGVLVVIATCAVPVSAQSPIQQASGSGVFTQLEILSTASAGPNRIEVRRITGQVSGDFTGIWTQEVRGVVHPNGEVTFHGIWSFTGQVGTCGEGTIAGQLAGRGTTGPPPLFPVTTAQARMTAQPANTVGIVGQGVVTQQGPFVTYTLQYRCH